MNFKDYILDAKLLSMEFKDDTLLRVNPPYDKISRNISIGIPTYNRPNRLRKVLRSYQFFFASNPAASSLNILISINGESQLYDTLKLEFSDMNISFISNPTGCTFGSNLKNLVNSANTEFMVFQGDDDYIPPSLIYTLSYLLESRDDIHLGRILSSPGTEKKSTQIIYVSPQTFPGLYSDNISAIYASSCLLHSLFEPINAFFIRVNHFRNLELEPAKIKYIFPQHALVANVPVGNIAFFSFATTLSPQANAFEEHCDKSSAGAGVLTLSFGLTERIMNRLAILIKSQILFDYDTLLRFIFSLWRDDCLVTGEFFLTDCKEIAKSIDLDFDNIHQLNIELIKFPLIFTIPKVFLALLPHAESYHSKFLWFCFGINALFFRTVFLYGSLGDRYKLVCTFQSLIASSQQLQLADFLNSYRDTSILFSSEPL